MGKPEQAKSDVPMNPIAGIGAPVKSVAIVKATGGKWDVLEFTTIGTTHTCRTVASEYYRDLAEDAAMRWLRRSGR
jgi:hypothetical protein